MASILLVGEDAALLEGLAQLLAGQGHSSTTSSSLVEARETARRSPPLVAVVDRRSLNGDDSLGMTLAAGGAAVLYRTGDAPAALLPAGFRRCILADLALPLERNRLLTLVQWVEERATAVGRRTSRNTPPESPAFR
jgi:DNA-binding NtrC family response regulator